MINYSVDHWSTYRAELTAAAKMYSGAEFVGVKAAEDCYLWAEGLEDTTYSRILLILCTTNKRSHFFFARDLSKEV